MNFTFIPERQYLKPRYSCTTYYDRTKQSTIYIASGYNWCGRCLRRQWILEGAEPTERERANADDAVKQWMREDSKYSVHEKPNYSYCNLVGCQKAVDIAWDMHRYAALAAQLFCCLSPGEAQNGRYQQQDSRLEYAPLRSTIIRQIEVPPNVQACMRFLRVDQLAVMTLRDTSVVFREIWRQTGIVYHLSLSGCTVETAYYIGEQWHSPMLRAYPKVSKQLSEAFYRIIPTQLKDRIDANTLALPSWFKRGDSATKLFS